MQLSNLLSRQIG
uniref:Uncharacterized protein n=1 Tax=Arundo donax TaxID=35708 RepID=A0A0A9AD18_ARUDO